MKYKLISQPSPRFNAKQQVLLNRGIDIMDLSHYMNLSDDDINSPTIFGNEISKATAIFTYAIKQKLKICVIVDCDCDGYTSSAIILNYIYDLSGGDSDYIKNKVDFFHHESKQHGLADAMTWIKGKMPDMVIVPDAGSNDVMQLKELQDMDIDVIILDHHEIEEKEFWSEEQPRIQLINSQLPQYPNKELSGVGVVYQFCRMVDDTNKTNYADNYLDLVALGNTGDMMSLRSFETRRLISKGLEPNNIRNPFMYEMWQKNKFKLGDTPTSWGVTFYIVPFVNAITRSGTLEEKKLIFDAMLKYKAFEQIPSNKRGHKPGEMERVVDQATRTCTNVKNRQGRAEDAGLALVEHLIKDNNMMDHKVLLFLMKPGQIQPEIRGLIANKLMARYQRPCCILTETMKVDEIPIADGKIFKKASTAYEGSARGCDKVGVTEFKDICAGTGVCEYTVGHQGAFGLGIRQENVNAFVEKTDEALKDMASEPIYYVDYIWSARQVDADKILEIADMAELWGKDMDEALVAVEGIKVTKDNLTMMASNTVKITLPNGISLIKFRMPDEEYNKLYSESGNVEINIVAKCNKNEWNGNISAQLLLEDYEIVRKCAYEF